MSMIQANGSNNNNLSRANRALAAGLLNPNSARALGSALARLIKSLGSDGGAQAPVLQSNRRQNSRKPRGGTRGGKGWSTYGSGGSASTVVPRPVQTKRIRANFTGSVVLGNRTAGVCNYSWPLSFDNGAGSTFLSYLNTTDTTMLKGFTYFKLYKVSVRLNPTLGTTATGYMSVGYTENLDTTLPASLTDITYCVQNATGSAWNPLEFSFKTQNKEPEYYLTYVGADVNHRGPGTFRIFCSNGAGIAANVAVMDIIVDMEVW